MRQHSLDILWGLWKAHKSRKICDTWINADKYEEKVHTCVWEQKGESVNFLSHET